MSKFIAIFVALFLFVLGGCATFRGLQEDSKKAAYKVKSMFSSKKKYTPGYQEIREAQRRLQSQGYRPGSADGIMGPQTVTALQEYQADKGLSVTGRVDVDTLDALGID